MKNYPALAKKWEKAKDINDKVEISMLIMKKIFSLKYYEINPKEGETLEAAKVRGI